MILHFVKQKSDSLSRVARIPVFVVVVLAELFLISHFSAWVYLP